MRWVRTRVLPEPAPARISSGPSPCVTASRWGALRPSSRESIAAVSGIAADGSGRPGSSLPAVSDPILATDAVRAACARVAGRARYVHIVEEAVAPYAATLASASPPAPDLGDATPEERAAFSLTLNAI